MPIFRFADLNVKLEKSSSRIDCLCADYIVDTKNVNINMELTREDVEQEILFTNGEFDILYLTTVVFLRKIAERLPEQNGFLMHGACFEVDGYGVIFGAHSGTGKTTHMLYWQQLLGERMTVVNGDKPIIRFFEDELNMPYAYGTPWNGKEGLGKNMRTPLKHICFIERSATNYVEQISPEQAVNRMLKQVFLPNDKDRLSNTFELVNRVLGSCKIWIIHCNLLPDSAKVAYETIFNS